MEIMPFIIIAIIIISRLIAGGLDSDRIQEEIESQGGKLISQTWSPFGKGWFGSRDRIYEVAYIDKEGNKHQAFVKTSMFGGVYFTDDQISQYNYQRPKSPDIHTSALQEENERLKKELTALKNKQA